MVLTVIFYLDFPVLNFRHLPITDGLLHMLICFQVKDFWKGQNKGTLDSVTRVGCRFSHVLHTASQEHPWRLFATAQSEKMSYQVAHSSPMILTSNQAQGHIRVEYISVLDPPTYFSIYFCSPDMCHWYLWGKNSHYNQVMTAEKSLDCHFYQPPHPQVSYFNL